MSTENITHSTGLSVHLPLGLLAFAAAVFLGSQIGAVDRGGKTLRWQLTNSEKQISNLADAKKQFAEALVKRDELVKQSAKVQEQYTALLNDVMELAKTDADAQKIVQKWGIQRQAPAADAVKTDEKPATKAPDAKK